MNNNEFAEYEANLKSDDQVKTELLIAKQIAETKTAQRQAILDRLGLTAEEAALLLG
jgi:hypothetical protein